MVAWIVLGLLEKVLLAIVLLIALGVAFVFVPNLIFYIFGAALLIGAFVYIKDDKIKAILALIGIGIFLSGFIGAQLFAFVGTNYDLWGSTGDSRCVPNPERGDCARGGSIDARIGANFNGFLSYTTGKEMNLPESNGAPYLYVTKQGCPDNPNRIECYKVNVSGEIATKVDRGYLSAIRTDDGLLGYSQYTADMFPPGSITTNKVSVFVDGVNVDAWEWGKDLVWIRDDYSSAPEEKTNGYSFWFDTGNIGNGLHSLEFRWHLKYARVACTGDCGCSSCDQFGGNGNYMPERVYEFEKTFFTQQVYFYKAGETPTQPVCGNGVCESGENTTNCSQDCGSNVFCGDGSCNGSETPTTCATDCPIPNTCGNGVCDALETPQNCATDCGGELCTELGSPPEGCLQFNWNAVHCKWDCSAWDIGELPLSCLTKTMAVTNSLGENCKVIDPTTGQPRNATTMEVVRANIWWFTILTAFLLVISVGGWYLTRKR